MTIRYENTATDAQHYNEYVNFNAPSLRRRYWIARIVSPFMVILLTSFYLRIVLYRPLETWHWVFMATMAALMFAFYNVIWRLTIRRNVKRLLKVGGYQGYLGDHTVTLTPEGIRSQSPIGESVYAWKAINRVEKSEQQILVFLSEALALPIPRRAFTDTAHETAFLASIEHYRNGATPVALPTVSTSSTSNTTSSAPWWTSHSSSQATEKQTNTNGQ